MKKEEAPVEGASRTVPEGTAGQGPGTYVGDGPLGGTKFVNDGLAPPVIPHITANYMPLEHLINGLVQRSYAELQNNLRTINSIPSDVVRKREILTLLVASRQEFVKLYVLCKWAAVAPDIARAIDVAAWLHGQHNAFNNVVSALFHLQQSMGSAKQQHADIESALQVVKYGGPTLSSFGFVTPQPLTNTIILDTMRQLNALLAIRLAVAEKLPPLYRNYSISSGRARFTVPGYMWLDIGVADDSVNAQFFYVDFGFTFTKAPVAAPLAARVETVVNDKLARGSLKQVLDWILDFTSNYKLALLHQQLQELEKSLWHGVLSHTFNPAKSVININYWLPRQGKYELIIGIGTSHMIQLRWELDGKRQQLPTDIVRDFGQQKLDIESLLNQVTLHHAHQLLDPLVGMFPWMQQSGENQFSLQFSPTRSVQFSFDHSSGKIVLQANGPLVLLAETALNETRDLSKASAILERLRLSIWQETTAQRAEAAGWVARSNLRLASGEIAKFGSDAKFVLVLRLPSWAEGWFVAVALGGETPRWVATQMHSTQRRWYVNSVHELNMDYTDPDYGVFKKLDLFCSRQFAMYDLCRELDDANVRYTTGKSKLELYIDLRTFKPKAALWANTGLKVIVSSTDVRLHGRAKNDALKTLGPIDEDGLVYKEDGEFVITVDRNGRALSQLGAKLDVLDDVAASLGLAQKANHKILSAKLHEITINYSPDDSSDGTLTIKNGVVEFGTDNPQQILTPFLTPLLAREGLRPVLKLLTISYPVFQSLATLDVVILPQSATLTHVQATSTSTEVPQLILELREWRKQPTLYATANETAVQIEAISKLFTQPSSDGVVPLFKGAAVPIDKSGELINQLVQAIKAA